jgi:hypothetical protein
MARVEFADPLGNAVSGFIEGRRLRNEEQRVMYDTVVAPAMRFKEMILDAQLKAGLAGMRGGGGGGGAGGSIYGPGGSIYGPGGGAAATPPLPQGATLEGLRAVTASSGGYTNEPASASASARPFNPGTNYAPQSYDTMGNYTGYGSGNFEGPSSTYTAQNNPLAESLRTRTADTAMGAMRDSFGDPNPRDRALFEYLGYGG